MWSILKYRIDGVNTQSTDLSQSFETVDVDIFFEKIAHDLEEYIKQYTDNYLISLHYLEFPVIFCFGNKKVPENKNLMILNEYVEPVKEVKKILLMNKAEIVSGFNFIRKQIDVQKEILKSTDQETFDRRAAQSGLEPYIINDLRTIWRNSRLEYLQLSLANRVEQYYKPDKMHPLYQAFIEFLEDTYRRGVDRFKTFICIGSTYIGKSIFFTKFIIPKEYYIQHSNYLEYSKMPDQPKKVFRILDDIHWEQVGSTELKALLNRNISSVNIKYGYEYIFPLIPIIIMNAEDYKIFRNHFSDIWEFIERNAVIYPPQTQGKTIIEEQRPLFTKEIQENKNWSYLFNEIISVNDLKNCNKMNLNEWIKDQLDHKQCWKYDTKKYIQLPKSEYINIPNPELSKKTILREYEEYILKKKQKEVEDSKKPKVETEETKKKPWYKSDAYKKHMDRVNHTNNKKQTKFDDLENLEDDSSDDSYHEKRNKNDDEDDDYDDMSEDSDSEGYDDGSDSGDEDLPSGFISI